MKRILLIGFLLFPLWSCVGQKEDPEPIVEPVTDPVDGSADMGTRFFRRTLAFDFTATWCQYCPDMAASLEEAKKLRPGRIVNVAVHYSDEIAPREANDIVQAFRVSAFPTLIFDMDPKTATYDPSVAPMTAYVDGMLEETAPCGIGWTLEDGSLVLKVKAAEVGEYMVAALLLEDGIITQQTGVGPYYSQEAVLRKVLTGTFLGDSIGTLSEGDEKTLPLGKIPPGDSYRVVAYVQKKTNGVFRVVNAVEGKPDQEKEYRFEPATPQK